MSECKDKDPGRVVPEVNRAGCEAKADCVRVCPYGVFEVQPLRPEDKAPLGLLARLKAFAHGNKQAYAVRAGECHGCGLCVAACPEKAIRLVPVEGR